MEEIKKYVNILNLCKIYTEDEEFEKLINIMVTTFNKMDNHNCIKLKLLMNSLKNKYKYPRV